MRRPDRTFSPAPAGRRPRFGGKPSSRRDAGAGASSGAGGSVSRPQVRRARRDFDPRPCHARVVGDRGDLDEIRGPERSARRIGVVGSPTTGRAPPYAVNAGRTSLLESAMSISIFKHGSDAGRAPADGAVPRGPCAGSLFRGPPARVARLAGTPRAAVSPGDGRGVLAHPRLCSNSTSAYADAQERIWGWLHRCRPTNAARPAGGVAGRGCKRGMGAVVLPDCQVRR